MHRAYHVFARHCQSILIKHPSNAEIRYLKRAVNRKQNILRLYIPMYYIVFMGVLQAVAYLQSGVNNFLKAQTALSLYVLL